MNKIRLWQSWSVFIYLWLFPNGNMGHFSLYLVPVEESRAFRAVGWSGSLMGNPRGVCGGGCGVAALQRVGFGAGFCRHTPCLLQIRVHVRCRTFILNTALLWGACGPYPHPWEWGFPPQTRTVCLSAAKWLNTHKNSSFFKILDFLLITVYDYCNSLMWKPQICLSGDGRINDSC